MSVRGYCPSPVRYVRYLPLGSPWSTPNRLFSTAEYVVRVVRRCRWVPGVVRLGGYRGRGSTHLVPVWPQIGIARAQPVALARVTVSPGALQALQALRTPLAPAPIDMPSWSQIGRDSGLNILKLVHNPECQPKYVMRPAMLPVSKTRSNVTTLNFQVLRLAEPSLTRNKWSQIRLGGSNMVKTAKCH